MVEGDPRPSHPLGRPTALPVIERGLREGCPPAQASVDPEDGHVIRIAYEAVADSSSYVRPEVMLEFGARSTGSPTR